MSGGENAEEQIAALELRLEEKERDVSLLFGIIAGLLCYIATGDWVWAVPVGVVVTVVYWKFLAAKPFTDNTDRPDRQ